MNGEIEEKLQQLREEYKTATLSERKLIEARANLLKWSQETGTKSVISGNEDKKNNGSSTLSAKEIEELFS